MVIRFKKPSRAGALFVAISILLAGCSLSNVEQDLGADLPVVLTTFTVLADIAQNVAGDKLRIESITKVGSEIHGYQPTPGDLIRAQDADLILDNGLNLEIWFEKFVVDLDVPHVVVSDGVELMEISEDSYRGLANPHAWMSPLNVMIYVDNMLKAFSALSPQDADYFQANAISYKEQLQKVQDDLIAKLANLKDSQRALVTCEGAFSYLARDAGLQEVYIWAVNAESQATPRQIAGVIEFVTANQVPAVFCESTVSDDAMQQVVSATAAKFGGVLFVDSLSEQDGPVPTYLDLIRYNAIKIAAGLTGEVND
ncbi:metal ABC transporter substrate-binding protein [Candidatus Aquiluna sp. UB-MaderosW2red]|uniref:metal ABC transporter substrate-binding protein n=1 Tax=Candidatus Aquiluna sp. UB-MaderosW2red TaxID=1855377 RepID=UPI000875DAD1|nr:metal ABC transporter substrate-binding protein [Candidatus Aquiluna sp. UB-MaderosW2red]SCX09961.1 manganese transport system substrate-binding protein [Candidatus Aquiluna sp. UB-MaderosW2red]